MDDATREKMRLADEALAKETAFIQEHGYIPSPKELSPGEEASPAGPGAALADIGPQSP